MPLSLRLDATALDGRVQLVDHIFVNNLDLVVVLPSLDVNVTTSKFVNPCSVGQPDLHYRANLAILIGNSLNTPASTVWT